ncbi:family 43 glycosylhydrolase [Bacillus sp. FJAT-49870]|uniref:Family 43 glycosylhydrolase n=2 Tax=Lederbergia citri TaxID=2833580 RepID=A0A942YGJ0_9BACI|nr:family 43 glycosylhydrolase [Lederbergia citri]
MKKERNNSRTVMWIVVAILLVGILISLIFLFQSQSSAKYKNPVFDPVFADPSVIQAKDGYIYAYGTEDDWGDGKGLRKIPIIRSKDLVDWEYVSDAFTDQPPTWKDGFLWAPHIAYFNNQYYLYYSMSLWGDPDPGIGVAISDKPEGPFTDQGPIFTSEEIGVNNSIDPYFMTDTDGTPYMVWGSFHGIYGIELTKDGLQTVGEKFQIAGNAFEAPWIIERDGDYYFFGSLGSCCEGELSTYRVSVGKADSIKGPYLDQDGNDLLYSEGTLILSESDTFAGPGHNAIIKDKKGTDWLVYHAIDKEDGWLSNGATKRPMMIDPIIWKDGWPMIKNDSPSDVERKGPAF